MLLIKTQVCKIKTLFLKFKSFIVYNNVLFKVDFLSKNEK